MSNRIPVTIGNQSYTLISPESPDYMETIAALVDKEIRQILAQGNLSLADAATLAAVNIADYLFKEKESSDLLRGQIKANADESSVLKKQLNEAKREVTRLKKSLKSDG